jgi:hypothetical protein
MSIVEVLLLLDLLCHLSTSLVLYFFGVDYFLSFD